MVSFEPTFRSLSCPLGLVDDLGPSFRNQRGERRVLPRGRGCRRATAHLHSGLPELAFFKSYTDISLPAFSPALPTVLVVNRSVIIVTPGD